MSRGTLIASSTLQDGRSGEGQRVRSRSSNVIIRKQLRATAAIVDLPSGATERGGTYPIVYYPGDAVDAYRQRVRAGLPRG